MNLSDFKRLIRPLTQKIFLLLGRAILKAVSNTEGTQKIQIVALDGETISDMERFQEYGFETYPFVDSEVFAIFLNGNRDHGITLCVHDRRYRPTNLSEGEVCIYTDEDATTEFRIQMKRDRIHYRRSDKEDIDIDTSKTEDIGTSKEVIVPSEINTNSTEHIINSPEITLGADAFASVRKLIDERFQNLFNNHVHSGVQGGGSNTGTPTSSLTSSHMTDKTRAV